MILGYHRVAEEGHDPYRLCVAPDRFAAQLEAIRRYTMPTRLGDLVETLVGGRPVQRKLVVTFDDGYTDVLSTAKPLLERYSVPATVFVVSGALGQSFWWDALARSLAQPDLPEAARRAADYERLRLLSAADRERVLDTLVTGGTDAPLRRAVSAAELRQLAEGDLIDIGSHSATHPLLSTLNRESLLAEIAGSRRALEAALGRPVTAFSYPHGDTSPAVAETVRAAGFTCACGSRNDVVSRYSDPFGLPRFWVPDWDGERFARWLRRWMGT